MTFTRTHVLMTGMVQLNVEEYNNMWRMGCGLWN